MTRKQQVAAAVLAGTLFAALGLAAPAVGQTATDEGVWTAVSLRGKVSPDTAWRWSADSFLQSRDGLQTLDVALGHVMVMRDAGRQASVGLGYAVGAGFRTSGPLLEQRLTQLVSWTGGRRTRVALRSLFEERFIGGRGAMLLRAREQVRVVWPIAAQRQLRAIVSEEVLVQADTRALTAPRLDGNRVFVGLGRTLSPGSSIEIGYLNVYSSAGLNRHQRSHVLSASLAVSLPQGRRR